MAVTSGTRVGPYEITGSIGAGGMGDVYRARDTRLRRDVALKFLHTGDAQNLLREAQAASALNHTNVCQVYDVGESEHGGWIAMEFVPGESLDRSIPAAGLPSETIVHIAAQIAEALAHAHRQGVLHRDLKTANCVRRPDGQIKVLDFGLAARSLDYVAHDVTHSASGLSRVVAGTPAYMAPEVIRGERADERSDLWALGIIMFELATGARPYGGTTTYELASSILTEPLRPLPASLPEPFRAIVARLLEKDRVRRYQSADEVRAALDVVRVGGTLPTAGRVTPKRALRLGSVAAATLAAFAAAGVWWVGRDRPLELSNMELLSTFDGSHSAPAISPAGDFVAFAAADADRVPQVWIKSLKEGPPIQITSGPVPAERPRWHPGGSAVVFARRGQGLWTIPSLGGTPTRIVERGTNPNFSRNGQRMTWETTDGIWVAAADGSGAHAVGGVPPRYYGIARSPALSPDGTLIAFFHPEIGPNGDIWVIPSEGGAARQLTHDVREGSAPTWTNDGARIVFSSARAGSRTLWQVPASGGEPEPLTTGAGEDDAPDLSADGTRLLFTNVRNSWRLIVAEGSGAERTLIERRSEMLFPMFSPNGSRIVFFGRAERAVAIFTIARDGSDLRQLTGGTELNHQPRWSHDGNEVWFYQLKPEQGLRRVAALGGPSVQVFPWEWQTHNAVRFDPTGQRIVYTRRNALGQSRSDKPERTVVYDIASGGEIEFPEPPLNFPRFSHDGRHISGWFRDGSVGFCKADGNDCRTVSRGASPVVWSSDDARLYFLRGSATGSDQEVWSVALDGQGERKERNIGTVRAIDRFFDLSVKGEIVSAPVTEGRRELWTAKLR
ncbi:MAG: protein kinase domain-containing protein [Vicinamibacterales bacterium]